MIHNTIIKSRILKSLKCITIISVVLFEIVLSGCGVKNNDVITGDDNPVEPYEEIGTDFSKYAGRKIGVITGSVQEKYVTEKITNGQCVYYDDESAMAVAVKQGKIDAFIMPYKTATELLKNNPNLTYDPVTIGADWISHCFSKTEKGRKLQTEFNEYIQEFIEDGGLAKLTEKWHDESKWTVPDYSRIENNTEIINYATVGTLMPFSFMGNGEYIGLELDMMIDFCEKYGYKLNVEITPLTSLLLGLSTGALDMGGGGIVYTEERAESILFGLSYYTSPQIIIIPKASSIEKTSFIDLIKNEFEKTFITQSRWKLFISGIGVTFLITICAFVLGSILGIGVCALMSSKNRTLNVICDWYIRILQGIPVVVILMVLCYVIFAQVSIDGIVVAIIGFALLVSSETGEIYFRSINSVSVGQKEAGLSIGLTPYQTFKGIVLPQAIDSILSGYKNCLVSLLKSTAVAGYIAVQDLTKMSDIIRSRTYSAFFPLISTAIIYFVASFLIAKLLERIIDRIKPSRTNRMIKGVKIHD